MPGERRGGVFVVRPRRFAVCWTAASMLTVVAPSEHLRVSAARGSRPAAQAPSSRKSVASDLTVEGRELLTRYCITCHNEKLRTANLMLDVVSKGSVSDDAATWEKVLGKIRTGAMPPPGVPRPETARYEAFGSWLETTLDRVSAVNPNP